MNQPYSPPTTNQPRHVSEEDFRAALKEVISQQAAANAHLSDCAHKLRSVNSTLTVIALLMLLPLLLAIAALFT